MSIKLSSGKEIPIEMHKTRMVQKISSSRMNDGEMQRQRAISTPPTLATRHRVTPVLADDSQSQLVNELLHPLPALVPRNWLRLQYRQDIVLDRQLAEDGWLLRQVTDSIISGPQIHGLVGNVLPIDQDPASLGRNQSDDNIENGGLAGAVRPQQTDHFTLFYVEADLADDPSAAVAFADLFRR